MVIIVIKEIIVIGVDDDNVYWIASYCMQGLHLALPRVSWRVLDARFLFGIVDRSSTCALCHLCLPWARSRDRHRQLQAASGFGKPGVPGSQGVVKWGGGGQEPKSRNILLALVQHEVDVYL